MAISAFLAKFADSMRLRFAIIWLLPVLLLQPEGAAAQAQYFGGYSSIKGVGVTYAAPSGDGRSFLSWTAAFDFSGLINRTERIQTPGESIRFSYDYLIHSWTVPTTGTSVTLFAGPGAMLGHVRDRDKKLGLAAAVAGDAGLLFDFRKTCAISLKFCADLGIHYGKRSQYEDINRYDPIAEFYKNGIYRLLFPEVRIMRRF